MRRTLLVLGILLSLAAGAALAQYGGGWADQGLPLSPCEQRGLETKSSEIFKFSDAPGAPFYQTHGFYFLCADGMPYLRYWQPADPPMSQRRDPTRPR